MKFVKRTTTLSPADLFSFLEEKHDLYNRTSFIEADPVSIPHRYSKKEDIEIAGFITATIAWGQRTTILNNSLHLMKMMDDAPHEFILLHSKKELKRFDLFVHRTFNGIDADYFIRSLQHIYRQYGGLENLFSETVTPGDKNLKDTITHFRKIFFGLPHPRHTEKHVSDPGKNSAAKRINMFLRWMVRKDKRGVDFGLWSRISPAQLSCPLDVHSGNIARKIGLLKRKQNDWTAVDELTEELKKFDPDDPVKYDFALFGLGVNDGLELKKNVKRTWA